MKEKEEEDISLSDKEIAEYDKYLKSLYNYQVSQ